MIWRLTIAALAEQAGVSEPTLVRFCRARTASRCCLIRAGRRLPRAVIQFFVEENNLHE
jgi:hypothetical protein